MIDHCTCQPGRAADGSEYGPCPYCEEQAWQAGIPLDEPWEDDEEGDRADYEYERSRDDPDDRWERYGSMDDA